MYVKEMYRKSEGSERSGSEGSEGSWSGRTVWIGGVEDWRMDGWRREEEEEEEEEDNRTRTKRINVGVEESRNGR